MPLRFPARGWRIVADQESNIRSIYMDKILIIDDSAVQAEHLKHILEDTY